MHWTLDHAHIKLSDFQVGAIGSASALLGLSMQWRAHDEAMRIEEEEAAYKEYEVDGAGAIASTPPSTPPS